MQVKDITSILETAAPIALQENYDNSGLCVGSFDQEIHSVLFTVDITEKVMDEAISKGINFIISHHPLIFQGLKKITGANETERCIIKSIEHKIAIYCAHTNLDNANEGVSAALSDKLGLINTKILSPSKNHLSKLVTFVPSEHANKVREALFTNGAGKIGNYDKCSYNLLGEGTFRANEKTTPFVGEKGQLHSESEIRIETIFPKHLQSKLLKALIESHPYEEPAFDIYPLENSNPTTGSGQIGEYETALSESDFLKKIKETLGSQYIRHTSLSGRMIKKVAVCGGSGSFLIQDAIRLKADAFVTGDLKYHQFFEPEGKLLLVDAGHYETEQFTKNIFYNLISKKFPTFASYFSEVNTNPLNFF